MPHLIRVNRLLYMLAKEDTTLLRLFFGLASILFGCRLMFDDSWHVFHESSLRIAPQWVLMEMFFAHGAAVVYGSITSRNNLPLLWLEGILGVFIWMAVAWTDLIDIGTASPSLVGAALAFFLLVRYPTHYGVKSHRRTEDREGERHVG
jgi:hypothetical protein